MLYHLLFPSHDRIWFDSSYLLKMNMRMYKIDNNIFFRAYYNKALTNPTENYDVVIGQITDDTAYTHTVINLLGSTWYSLITYLQFSIIKQFNLIKYVVQTKNTVYLIREIYNENNYNGISYENYDSLIPKQIYLYNTDLKVIFARNLYNLSIVNNTFIASLEIPNTFLNDIIIDNKELISDTNTLLLNNITQFTKNIYETVLVNFINNINIDDSNNPPQFVYSQTGANKLNLATNTGNLNNYNNTKAIKFKRVFVDNSYDIFEIPDENIIYNNDDTNPLAEINMYFYVQSDKTIKCVQIISNDESTVYLKINMTGKLSDKTYHINQKVRII